MEIIVMPKLGFNMDEGRLTVWYKKEGETVKKGEALFAIETDKTAIDVEATQDGVVRRLLIAEGDIVPVTLPIAIVGGKDEDITAAEADARKQLAGGTAVWVPAETASADPLPSAAAADPEYDFDVFVVGGGPGGYVAAIRAAQLGLRIAIAEKDTFGGVCLNRGCIPAKTLLRSAEALLDVKDAGEYGVAGFDAARVALDMAKVQKRKGDVVAGLVSGVEGLLAKNKVAVFKGEAKILDKNTVRVDAKTYSTAALILATGSISKELPVGVVQTDTCLTSDEILGLKKLPKEMTIIGGGVIGIEFAYFLACAGTKVVIVEFLDRILPPIDAEIAALVRKDLEAMGVCIHTGAKVTKVSGDAVEYEKDGSTELVKTKNVLLAVGRRPYVPEDVLALGLETEPGGAVAADKCLRTSVDGVFAIGDMNGRLMLAHTASAEGVVAAEVIAGHSAFMDYSAIPSVVYTQPEAASVGLSEEDARAKYGAVKVGRFPIAANGKSRVSGDSRGLVKVIVTPEFGEIVGVHLYCLHASDMIAEAAVAMRGEVTAEEVGRTIHPHPTVSEAMQEAMDAAVGVAIHC